MATAKKATLNDCKIKMMLWGEPGAGKSRFALSAPSPLVIDLENSTSWYAGQFDFYKATIDETEKTTKNATALTTTIVAEILAGEYNDVETLIIDPVTDLLDNLETLCTLQYERDTLKGKKVTDLNPLEKSKFYSFRRTKMRELLDRILNININIIFVARAKNVWGKTEKGMAPVDKTFDGIDLIEYLPDLVVNLRREDGEPVADIKKSRMGKFPESVKMENWQDLLKLLIVNKEEWKPVKSSNVVKIKKEEAV